MRFSNALKTFVPATCALALLTASVSMAQAAKTARTDTATAAATRQIKPQTTCPVMGEAIDKSLFVDHNGKRIYVCCSGCIATVRKDPEKYIKKLEGQGQSVEAIAGATGKAAGKADTTVKATKVAADTASKAADAGYYTCSMHPEVHAAQAGKCPKCGMALVFKKETKDTTKARSTTTVK